MPASEDKALLRRTALASQTALVGAQTANALFRRRNLAADNKDPAHYDPVTDADRNAEQAMRAQIKADCPDDTIEGEEFGLETGENAWHWYLDPVDGTRAFISGIPLWTTLVGLAWETQMRIGCIAQPMLGELYQGDMKNAYLSTHNGPKQTLSVSDCQHLNAARLSTTDPNLFLAPERTAYDALYAQTRLCRYGLDAYAYARLAAGDIDLVVESALQAYDVAALIPIVTGAGGIVTDWQGHAPKLGGQIIAAATPELLAQALVYLSPASASDIAR